MRSIGEIVARAARACACALGIAVSVECLAVESLKDFEFEPPPPRHPVRIVDSKIEIPRLVSAHWVDEHTVIFNAITKETWEHWTPLRQVPVIRLTSWNTRTGEIRYFDEVSDQSSVICYFDGNLLIHTYARAEDGSRVRKDGRYVFERRRGRWSDTAPSNSTLTSIAQDDDFDRTTCLPDREHPSAPGWIEKSAQSYRKLPAEWGIIVAFSKADVERLEPRTLFRCSYASLRAEDCFEFRLSRGGPSSVSSYVPFLDAFQIDGYASEPKERTTPIAFAGRDFVRTLVIRSDGEGNLATGGVFTQIGILLIYRNFRDPTIIGNGGLWLWNRGKPIRLAPLAASSAQSGNAAVSPNGCTVAFAGSNRPSVQRQTLQVAHLC